MPDTLPPSSSTFGPLRTPRGSDILAKALFGKGGGTEMGVLMVFSPLLLAAGAPAVDQCAPVPGWEQVLADADTRWIVIGELHGTVETPALFSELVCLTARERPLAVALEFPSQDQARLDAYLQSDGGEEARRGLFGALVYTAGPGDGRSSRAMFDLIERLRLMRQAGAVDAVIAFQPGAPPPEGFTPQWYERRMAEIVREGAPPDATVLVLVGSTHARKSEVTFRGQIYLPMAAHLPRERTMALFVRGNGGSAWNCQGSLEGGQPHCRAHEMPADPSTPARGIALEAWEDGSYDGTLSIGTAHTASPPFPPRR